MTRSIQLAHISPSRTLQLLPLQNRTGDAVGPLRYLLPPKNFPSTCACGAQNSVNHAQNCHLGGFLGLRRHDTIRDTIANLLETAKGCKDIEIEKHLTPLEDDEKKRAPRTSNTTEGARMDITALGFWGAKSVLRYSRFQPTRSKQRIQEH